MNEANATTATPTDGTEKMISIEEAAARYGVASRVLRAALGAEECKGHDFGGRVGWRMWPHHVVEWLDSLVNKGKAAPKGRKRVTTKRAKEAAAKDKPTVKVGQVWIDRAKPSRKVKVTEVGDKAIEIHNMAHKDPSTRGTVKCEKWHRYYSLAA